MYYDDEARRFNFLSGLLFGSVLGAGLALLLPPQEGVRARRLLRGPRSHRSSVLGRLSAGRLRA